MKSRKTKKTKTLKTILMLLYFAVLPITVVTTCLCIYIMYVPETYQEDAISPCTDELPIIIVSTETRNAEPMQQINQFNKLDGQVAANAIPEEDTTIIESTYEMNKYYGVSASKQAALEKEVEELMELTDRQ